MSTTPSNTPSKKRTSFLGSALEADLDKVHSKTHKSVEEMARLVTKRKQSSLPDDVISSGTQSVQVFRLLNRKLKAHVIETDQTVTNLINELVYKYCKDQGLL